MLSIRLPGRWVSMGAITYVATIGASLTEGVEEVMYAASFIGWLANTAKCLGYEGGVVVVLAGLNRSSVLIRPHLDAAGSTFREARAAASENTQLEGGECHASSDGHGHGSVDDGAGMYCKLLVGGSPV